MIDFGRVSRLSGAGWFLPVGPALLAGSFVPSLHHVGTQYGGLPDRPYDVLAVLAIVLQCVPLVRCRPWPVTCLSLVSLGFAVDQLRGYHTFAGTALVFAVLNAGSWAERGRRGAAVGFTVAYALFAAVFPLLGAGETLADAVFFYLAVVLAWGIGAWLRSTRIADAERRRRVAEDTLAAERARVARELHDVVTHQVSVMLAQAEAAREQLTAPERVDRRLVAVADSGRQAVTDLRQLLDVLDPGHGPAGDPPRGP